MVSAWASTQRLVLAQEAIEAKDNECAAILAILGRLAIQGALVTIDAIATRRRSSQAAAMQTIVAGGGDYVLALKRDQPTLHGEAATCFADPATPALPTVTPVDKDHGRIETRTTRVSHDVAWMMGERRHPGGPRSPALASLIQTTTRVERRGKTSEETRCFITSARLTPERAAEAIRAHWGLESLHWILDVIFKEDQPASDAATAPATWRSCEGSPSTSCERAGENAPSKPPAKPQDGAQTSSLPSSNPKCVNLDSLP